MSPQVIRIHKRLDSATVPELEPMIGRQVEIIVIDEEAASTTPTNGAKPGDSLREWGKNIPSLPPEVWAEYRDIVLNTGVQIGDEDDDERDAPPPR